MAGKLWLTAMVILTAICAAAINQSVSAGSDKAVAGNTPESATIAEPVTAHTSPADIQSSQNYFQNGQALRRRNQYLLAMLHLDQALRLNPGNREALTERSLCASEFKKGIPVTVENDSADLKESIVETLGKIQEAWNKHDIEAFLHFYETDYLNEDGYNKAILAKLTSDYWKTYPDAHSVQGKLQVYICRDYASVTSEDTATGTASPSKLGTGSLKVKSQALMLLHRSSDGWKVVGDIILKENAVIGYGLSADAAIPTLSAANSVEKGKESSARLIYETKSTVWASITASPIKYPPKPPRDTFFVVHGTMDRIYRMPALYQNALILATVWASETNNTDAPSQLVILSARANSFYPGAESTAAIGMLKPPLFKIK